MFDHAQELNWSFILLLLGEAGFIKNCSRCECECGPESLERTLSGCRLNAGVDTSRDWIFLATIPELEQSKLGFSWNTMEYYYLPSICQLMDNNFLHLNLRKRWKSLETLWEIPGKPDIVHVLNEFDGILTNTTFRTWEINNNRYKGNEQIKRLKCNCTTMKGTEILKLYSEPFLKRPGYPTISSFIMCHVENWEIKMQAAPGGGEAEECNSDRERA